MNNIISRRLFLLCFIHILMQSASDYACSSGMKVAMDSDDSGNIFAVWSFTNQTTNCCNIFSSVKPIGGEWSAAQKISGSNNKSVVPIIEVHPNGNTAVLWMSTMDNGSNGLMVATLASVNDTWSLPTTITQSDENVVNDWYNLEINSSGITAIWSSFMIDNETGDLIQVMRTAWAPFGGSWSAPSTIG